MALPGTAAEYTVWVFSCVFPFSKKEVFPSCPLCHESAGLAPVPAPGTELRSLGGEWAGPPVEPGPVSSFLLSDVFLAML